MTASPPNASAGRVGLLLSHDLIFTTKIVGTARGLGFVMLTAGSESQATELIEKQRPLAVFVDLSSGSMTGPDAIRAYRKLAPEIPFLAFGSHVDMDLLNAAREAGCDPVLPRSRFASELPALITRYLGNNGESG